MFKRLFDIVGASLLLVVLSPVLWFVIYKLAREGGPVFYLQYRLGLHGREFWVLKFTTMHPNSDVTPRMAEEGDERVTETGVSLRQYFIDELPQLINVIRGEMSLVGPRPIPRDYVPVELMGTREHFRRLSVRPGLTGPMQIRGRKWLIENGFAEMFQLEAAYARIWWPVQFFVDIYILCATIPMILKGKGI